MQFSLCINKQNIGKVALCRLAFLFISSTLLMNVLLGQNLIPNPSFEITKTEEYELTCSFMPIEGHILSFWKQQNTADFISINHPLSRRGDLVTLPSDGIHMVGLFLNTPQLSGISEYIYTKPIRPIKEDCHYQFEAKLKFSDLYSHQANTLEIKLIHEDLCERNIQRLSGQIISIPIDIKTLNKDSWITIRCDFRANDNYEWLAIGNITNSTKYFTLSKKARIYGAYIYMDELSLIDLSGCSQNFIEEESKLITKDYSISDTIGEVPNSEESILISDVDLLKSYSVFFDFNSNFISEESKFILEKVIDQFDSSQNSLLIVGHTDLSGNETYNFQLAMKRAEVICAFFVSRGIPNDQITVISKGKTEPIVISKDEILQSLNRRVEIFLKPKVSNR